MNRNIKSIISNLKSTLLFCFVLEQTRSFVNGTTSAKVTSKWIYLDFNFECASFVLQTQESIDRKFMSKFYQIDRHAASKNASSRIMIRTFKCVWGDKTSTWNIINNEKWDEANDCDWHAEHILSRKKKKNRYDRIDNDELVFTCDRRQKCAPYEIGINASHNQRNGIRIERRK